jgi:hypothetical protein
MYECLVGYPPFYADVSLDSFSFFWLMFVCMFSSYCARQTADKVSIITFLEYVGSKIHVLFCLCSSFCPIYSLFFTFLV